jgi:hypothetical protein
MSNKEKNYTKWTFKGSNTYFPSDNVSVVDSVLPGVYDIKHDQQQGYYLLKKDIFLDELFPMPGNVQDKILKDATDFWENKENFKKYGYAYKRGIL